MRFLYQLSRELGRTVKELRDDMDADEFMEWWMLYEVEAEEADRLERGEAPRPPVTSDPGEIARWFSRN